MGEAVDSLPEHVSGRPDPSGADTPEEFLDALNRLRVWAGRPSLRTLRDLARPAEPLPTSTVHDVLAGRRLPRLPRLEFVEAFVRACLRAHGESGPAIESAVRQWREAWRRLASVPRATPVVLPAPATPPAPAVPDPAPPDATVAPRMARIASAVGLFLLGLLIGLIGGRVLPADSARSGAPPAVPPGIDCVSAPPAERGCAGLWRDGAIPALPGR